MCERKEDGVSFVPFLGSGGIVKPAGPVLPGEWMPSMSTVAGGLAGGVVSGSVSGTFQGPASISTSTTRGGDSSVEPSHTWAALTMPRGRSAGSSSLLSESCSRYGRRRLPCTLIDWRPSFLGDTDDVADSDATDSASEWDRVDADDRGEVSRKAPAGCFRSRSARPRTDCGELAVVVVRVIQYEDKGPSRVGFAFLSACIPIVVSFVAVTDLACFQNKGLAIATGCPADDRIANQVVGCNGDGLFWVRWAAAATGDGKGKRERLVVVVEGEVTRFAVVMAGNRHEGIRLWSSLPVLNALCTPDIRTLVFPFFVFLARVFRFGGGLGWLDLGWTPTPLWCHRGGNRPHISSLAVLHDGFSVDHVCVGVFSFIGLVGLRISDFGRPSSPGFGRWRACVDAVICTDSGRTVVSSSSVSAAGSILPGPAGPLAYMQRRTPGLLLGQLLGRHGRRQRRESVETAQLLGRPIEQRAGVAQRPERGGVGACRGRRCRRFLLNGVEGLAVADALGQLGVLEGAEEVGLVLADAGGLAVQLELAEVVGLAARARHGGDERKHVAGKRRAQGGAADLGRRDAVDAGAVDGVVNQVGQGHVERPGGFRAAGDTAPHYARPARSIAVAVAVLVVLLERGHAVQLELALVVAARIRQSAKLLLTLGAQLGDGGAPAAGGQVDGPLAGGRVALKLDAVLEQLALVRAHGGDVLEDAGGDKLARGAGQRAHLPAQADNAQLDLEVDDADDAPGLDNGQDGLTKGGKLNGVADPAVAPGHGREVLGEKLGREVDAAAGEILGRQEGRGGVVCDSVVVGSGAPESSSTGANSASHSMLSTSWPVSVYQMVFSVAYRRGRVLGSSFAAAADAEDRPPALLRFRFRFPPLAGVASDAAAMAILLSSASSIAGSTGSSATGGCGSGRARASSSDRWPRSPLRPTRISGRSTSQSQALRASGMSTNTAVDAAVGVLLPPPLSPSTDSVLGWERPLNRLTAVTKSATRKPSRCQYTYCAIGYVDRNTAIRTCLAAIGRLGDEPIDQLVESSGHGCVARGRMLGRC
ncbi:hypothetical protein SPBR_00053 [Sporothrix brasiliensis 5110]|uniref:Uncharacterized protein n=1 Tax=Sporothrix brasiliensis 5110 TaxID=1398154 RepID=A0A0C2FIG8_9PEZI|nr:uncharacterized protein SPBR_00053 [Sporothrix brasiliensis 5110]KIH90883.1 hypothetical protein SPBR_00053 [Sporothrix brasiliensis 5110]